MYEQLRKELEADKKWDRLYWCEEEKKWGFMANFGEMNCYWTSITDEIYFGYTDIFGGDIVDRSKVVFEEDFSLNSKITPLYGHIAELRKIIAMARLVDQNCPWKIAENIEE